MYKAFYEMQRLPFVRDIPSGMLYESPAMADTLGCLSYAADRQLFAVVTADAGCGKSTLVRRFVETIPKEEYLLSNTPALFLCYQIFKGNPFFNHIVNLL